MPSFLLEMRFRARTDEGVTIRDVQDDHACDDGTVATDPWTSSCP